MSAPRVLGPLLLLLLVTAGPASAEGLTPADLHSAYELPRTTPDSRTVAVISAYDAPTVAADLLVAARRYGLPLCRATGASPCFRKVNQRGDAGALPVRDLTGQDWIVESALGTQAVRAVCQNCRVLLVEADSPSKADLSAAVETAVRLGAREVSTSFAPPELPGDRAYTGAYSHPGVVVTAATGDGGFTAEPAFPSTMPTVVAVGGTELTLGAGGRYGSERAWARGGSGCSTVFSASPGQATSLGCGTGRAVADVAAAADPGLMVHIGSPVNGDTGWFEVGGTSLASPIIAASFALAGGVAAGTTGPDRLRSARGGLRDVVAGANGTCGGGAICAARRGIDGPTGAGSPRGLLAFAPPGSLLDPARPRVTLRAPRAGVRPGRDGRVRLALANANAFPLRASSVLRAPGAGTLALGTARLGPRARGTVVLRLGLGPRALLRRRHRVSAVLETVLSGPRGSGAVTRSPLRVVAP